MAGITFVANRCFCAPARFFGAPAWCFGISAQGIGTVGMMLNLVATFTVSRMTAPPSQAVQDLVESVRSPGPRQTERASH